MNSWPTSSFSAAPTARQNDGLTNVIDAVAVDLDDEVGLHVGQQLQALAQAPDLVVVDGLDVRLADEQHVGHRPRLAALGDRPEGDAYPDLLTVGAPEVLLEDLLAFAAKSAGAVGPPGHDAGPVPPEQVAARAAHELEQRRVEGDRLAGVAETTATGCSSGRCDRTSNTISMRCRTA